MNNTTCFKDDMAALEQCLKGLNLKYDGITGVCAAAYTLYKVKPSMGEKISRFRSFQEEISLSMGRTVRVVTLPDSVGIELPHSKEDRKTACYVDMQVCYSGKETIPVVLGESADGKIQVEDLARMPHLLIAGATKQGETNAIRVMIASMIKALPADKLKFALFDPKQADLECCRNLLEKGYLAVIPDRSSSSEEKEYCIVRSATEALSILASLEKEMEERYEAMAKCSVRNMEQYHEKYGKGQLKYNHLPYYPFIVAVIDEFADYTRLADSKLRNQIQNKIIRLAQKGRCAGIHMVLATQRPCVDVISGIMKANFPSRLAFRTASRVDSISVIDCPGAETLCGSGDALYMAGVDLTRIQVPYLPETDFEQILESLAGNDMVPYYLPYVDDDSAECRKEKPLSLPEDADPMLYEAAMLAVMTRKASVSMLQKKLQLGFARASRIMDQLEAKGVVSGFNGTEPRQVLINTCLELKHVFCEE